MMLKEREDATKLSISVLNVLKINDIKNKFK